MFIKQLDITEFRGVKRCEKPLELSKFTVLVGRNNAGKSATLEALYLLVASNGYQSGAYNVNPLAILWDLHGGPSFLVYGYSGTAKVEYIINESKIRTESDGKNIKLLRDNQIIRFADLSEKLNFKFTPKNTDSAIFLVPSDTSLLKKLVDSIFRGENWNLVMKSGAHLEVIKLVNKCVDDRYTEVYKAELRKEVAGNIFYIKIEDVGEGLKKAIPVMLWLEAVQPSVVLWDDFEASAHPSLIKQLITWLSKKGWQVVISTHSIDVLSQLLEVKPENAKVIQLQKTWDDVLHHRSLTMDQLEDIIDLAQQDPRLITETVEGKKR